MAPGLRNNGRGRQGVQVQVGVGGTPVDLQLPSAGGDADQVPRTAMLTVAGGTWNHNVDLARKLQIHFPQAR